MSYAGDSPRLQSPYIQKYSIIHQVPLDTHKIVINVTDLETIRKIIKSRNEGNGSFQESSVVKLGEGGYNEVFLISLVSSLMLRSEVTSVHYIRALIQIHSFCGSRRKNAFSFTKY